jgi:ribosome maturation factor RimP
VEVEALVRPVVESAGLELVEAVFRREGGRRVLRVTVDREGGVDLDTVAEASERISRRLDIEDFAAGSYTLEVSSPGVERHLRGPRDFVRAIGRRVKVRAADPEEGGLTLVGTIVAADEDAVTVATDGAERRVTYPLIRSARTVLDWGPAQKPGQKRGARGARKRGPGPAEGGGLKPSGAPGLGR